MTSRPQPLDPAPEGTAFASRSADDTCRLGQALAGLLRPGLTVCLTGPLGAGNSLLARAMIRTALGDPEADVPSPSYTLANVYAWSHGEIWHVDLYRLSDPGELSEIGLGDAAESAALLVEWPEPWPDPPAERLDIVLEILSDDERRIAITPSGRRTGAEFAAIAQELWS